jgi:hypothetical protein
MRLSSLSSINRPSSGAHFLCVVLLLAWECLDDKWRRFDAFDWSSVLVSFVTRFQVSCGDSSPSSLHLRLDRWWADMLMSIIQNNLMGAIKVPFQLEHLVNGRNNKESSIWYKSLVKCSELTFMRSCGFCMQDWGICRYQISLLKKLMWVCPSIDGEQGWD